MFKNILKFVAPLAVMLGFMTQAHAAVDIVGVLSGITDAGAAILSVIGALLVLSTSIFGIVKVYKFVSSKAGA